jgi:hypothetical protein
VSDLTYTERDKCVEKQFLNHRTHG